MPLILTMTQTSGTRPRGSGGGTGGDRQIRTLAQGTLSIGRAPGNDWVLADPDQHLSRTHCMIAFEAGRYVLTDLSTNGLLINGAREPTTRNSRTVLTDGDTVQLGNYTLSVAEADGPAAGMGASPFGAGSFLTPRADPLSAPTSGHDGNPLDIDPLEDPLGHGLDTPAALGFQHPLPHVPPALRVEDPFDLAESQRRRAQGTDPGGFGQGDFGQGDFGQGGFSGGSFPGGGAGSDADMFRGQVSAEAWKGPTQSDNADPRAQAFTTPRPIATAPPVNINDIDFDDLLGDIMPTPAAHPLAPPPAPLPAGFTDALDDLLGDFPPGPPTAPPAPHPPAPHPPAAKPAPGDGLLAGSVSEAAPEPSAPSVIATMKTATLDNDPPSMAPPAAASPLAAPQPPRAAPPVTAPPVTAQPVPVPPVGAPAADQPAAGLPAHAAAALLAAFAEGAGIPQIILGSQDPQAAMRAIGALFGAFVAGTREVLMSRAEIKHEMRVEQTMLRARDNNALKFSVSPQEAVAALLQPARPGYKPPLAAVEEAFNDIRSHEMAVMAGLQTALIALLKRFDPATLESRLQRGMLDAVLPAARKARFWELFCVTYKDIASEAQDDFQSIFGREFARAYDAQIRKL